MSIPSIDQSTKTPMTSNLKQKEIDCSCNIFEDDETVVVTPPGGFEDIFSSEKGELRGQIKNYRILYRKLKTNADKVQYKIDDFGSKHIVGKNGHNILTMDEMFKEFLPSALQAKEINRFLTEELDCIPQPVIEFHQYINSRAKRYYNVMSHMYISEIHDSEIQQLPGFPIDVNSIVAQLGNKHWQKTVEPLPAIGKLKIEISLTDPDLADNFDHPYTKINTKILNMLANSAKNPFQTKRYFYYEISDPLCETDFRAQAVCGICLKNEWFIGIGSTCFKHLLTFIPTRSDNSSGFLLLNLDRLGTNKKEPTFWEKGPCYVFEMQTLSKRAEFHMSTFGYKYKIPPQSTYKITATYYLPWDSQDPMGRNSLKFAFEYDESSDNVIFFRQRNADRMESGEGMLYGEELERFKIEILSLFASSKKEWTEDVKKNELKFSQFLVPLPSTCLDYFRFRMDFAAEVRKREKEDPGSCTSLIQTLAEYEEIPFVPEKTMAIAEEITLNAIKDFNEAKSHENTLRLDDPTTSNTMSAFLENKNNNELKKLEKLEKKKKFLAKETERKFQEAKQKKQSELSTPSSEASTQATLRRKEREQLDEVLQKNKVMKDKSFRRVAQALIATMTQANTNNNNSKAEVTQTDKGSHQNLHIKTADQQGKVHSTGVTLVSAHKRTVQRSSYLKDIFNKVKEVKKTFPKK